MPLRDVPPFVTGVGPSDCFPALRAAMGKTGRGVEINLGGGLGPEHGAVVAIGSKEGAEEVM